MLALSEATRAALRAALPPEGSLPLTPYRALMPLLCDPDAGFWCRGWGGARRGAPRAGDRLPGAARQRGARTGERPRRPRGAIARGALLDELGTDRFAEELASLADGVVLDTRVLLAHAGSRASREDRFQSDLLGPEGSRTWLRDLTAALAAAEAPVLPGGTPC